LSTHYDHGSSRVITQRQPSNFSCSGPHLALPGTAAEPGRQTANMFPSEGSLSSTASNSHLGTWYGTAWLIGQAAFQLPGHSDATSSWPLPLPAGVTVTLHPPEALHDSQGRDLVRQRLTSTCVAPSHQLRRVMEQLLESIVDFASFHTLRAVRLHVEPFAAAPPPPPGSPYRAISLGQITKAFDHNTMLLPLQTAIITASSPRFSEPHAERLSRALRWLRRSLLATDPLLTFASLAFGLEAAAPCLSLSPGGSTSVSDRLRTFAVSLPTVTPEMWKRVGSLRHTLFHGGLAESAEVVEQIMWAAMVAEHVLVAGLRTALALAPGTPPDVPALHGSVSDSSMESDGFIRPLPPASL